MLRGMTLFLLSQTAKEGAILYKRAYLLLVSFLLFFLGNKLFFCYDLYQYAYFNPICFLNGLTVILLFFWYKSEGDIQFISNLFLSLVFLNILKVVASTGAICSPITTAFVLMPLGGFMLLNKYWGGLWFVIICLTLIFLGTLPSSFNFNKNLYVLTILAFFISIPLVFLLYDIKHQKSLGILNEQQTLLERHKNELEQKVVALEDSNQQLEYFAFIASHDLKNPLIQVITLMDFIQRELETKNKIKFLPYIDKARQEASLMSEFVSRVLDYSKIEITNELELVDLNIIVEQVKVFLQNLIKRRTPSFFIEQLPIVRTHRAYIMEVFCQLIKNACLYNTSKSPVIQIYCLEEQNQYKLSIQDNGIGIPQKEVSKVFDMFYRIPFSNEEEGIGLGLAVARKSIETLGGTIWIEPLLDEGVTVCFTLPKTKGK